MKCAFCGRPTKPYVMIGAQAVGPVCARRAGLTPSKAPKGGALRFVAQVAGKRRAEPETLDMFAELEREAS